MGSIGAPEILVVLVVALIVLGPKRLPDAARQLGRAINEFRRVSSDLQSEVRQAFEHDELQERLPTEAPIEPPIEPPAAPTKVDPPEAQG